jgi:hypothetical protein
VGSLAGVQRVLRSNNVNSDLRNINLTAASLSTMYSSQPNTAVVAMATLVGLRVFEGFAVNAANNTVTNAFGGQITVTTNAAAIDGFPANSGFMVYSTNIPSEACPDYLNGLQKISPNMTTTNAVDKAFLRVRRDGLMRDVKTYDEATVTQAMSAVYTLMAEERSRSEVAFNLNATQSALIPLTINRAGYGLRYQSHPAVSGYDVIMRVLKTDARNDAHENLALSKLGFTPWQSGTLNDALGTANGGIFIAGTCRRIPMLCCNC